MYLSRCMAPIKIRSRKGTVEWIDGSAIGLVWDKITNNGDKKLNNDLDRE